MIVIDDAILQAVLSKQPDPAVAPYLEAAERGELATTMSWFWRLSRALSHPGGGALSRQFASLTEEEQRSVSASLFSLPEQIEVLSARRLVPTMAAIPGQLNMLAAEAVATAVLLDASIAVTTRSELLERSADQLGIRVDVVQLGL